MLIFLLLKTNCKNIQKQSSCLCFGVPQKPLATYRKGEEAGHSISCDAQRCSRRRYRRRTAERGRSSRWQRKVRRLGNAARRRGRDMARLRAMRVARRSPRSRRCGAARRQGEGRRRRRNMEQIRAWAGFPLCYAHDIIF